MNDTNIGSLLAEAAEQIRREAYAAGWRDAVAALNRAVGELAEPSSEDTETLDFSPVRTPQASGTANLKLPKQGSTPWEVIQAVKKRPGMTAMQIIEALKASGHGAPDNSIRTSISRAKNRRFIVARHNKWYPA